MYGETAVNEGLAEKYERVAGERLFLIELVTELRAELEEAKALIPEEEEEEAEAEAIAEREYWEVINGDA